MIYKSRNGIGISVILITLFFSFMLTDANPKYMDGLAKKCVQPICCDPSITPKSVNPNLNEEKDLYEKVRLTVLAIKNIEKEEYHTCKCRFVFGFFAFLTLITIMILAIKVWIEKKYKSLNPYAPFQNSLHNPVPFYAPVIYVVLVTSFLVFFACGCCGCYRQNKIEACEKLQAGIERELLIEVDQAFIDLMLKKIEENIEAEKIMYAMEMKIARFEEIKKQEVVQIKSEKITEEEVVKKAEKIKVVGETRSEEIKTKEDSGKKVSEVENVKKFSEETDISMESESTITDTSTKSDQESVTSQFITRSLAQNRKKNYGGEKRREKKGAQGECILANIDFNLFIYAMVFVFALFLICAICNLKEEEATGEIKEEEATGEINEV